MRYEFPVHYQRDAENPSLWEAAIPGLDGTEEGPGTCGDDIDDVRKMASGLVDAWISIYLKDGRPIPVPGPKPEGEGWEWAKPGLRTMWVLLLRETRSAQGLSQAEAARRLKISQPVYARLEDPSKANPTLETVERFGRTFGVPLGLVG